MTMVIVVGLATLVRRGWRAAALHTVPLAAVFLAWWIMLGRQDQTEGGGVRLGQMARFVTTGMRADFQ